MRRREGQLLALLEQCAHLNADVQPRTEQGVFYGDGPAAVEWPTQAKSAGGAEQDQKWSEQYPNVICYCFDSFSTLLYVL